MRILALNWRDLAHPLAGGAEVYIHELAKHWIAWGHDVTLLSGGFTGGKGEETVGGLKIVRRGGRLTVYPRACLEYLLRLRRECDVVLDIENGIPFFAPLYTRRPTVIVVHHVHQQQVFVEARFPLNWLAYLSETWVMPVAYRRCVFIAGTASTRDGLIRFGVAAPRIRMVPYGLDHRLYTPWGEKSPTPSILYLGRLKRYKRIDLLLRAMPEILRAFPEASLWIVGRGDAQPALERLAGDLDLSRHARFWGYVDEREKTRLLRQAWLFVNPSMNEGWGLSVLEANACGTPAVVFDVPGLRDAVLDGETGLLVPDGDVGQLCQMITLVLRDESLRHRLGQNATAWSQRFTWEQAAQSMLTIFQEILAEAS